MRLRAKDHKEYCKNANICQFRKQSLVAGLYEYPGTHDDLQAANCNVFRQMPKHELRQQCKPVPPVQKRLLNCWFYALVDAIIVGIMAFYDSLNCGIEDAPAVIKSFRLNGNPKALFVLVVDLLQWIWLPHDLVQIHDDIDCLVISVAELT